MNVVQGLENIPTDTPVVLVPNHSSYFDHFIIEIIAGSYLNRPVWFLTKKESFDNPFRRLWTRAWFGIPVEREAPTPETLREVREVLQSGGALCVYPEGTRNVGNELLPFKPGAFRFAISNGAQVVPVGIAGSQSVLPKGARWFYPGAKAQVVFGKPIEAPTEGSAAQRAEKLSTDVERAVRELRTQADLGPARNDSDPKLFASIIDQRVQELFDESGQLPPGAASHLLYLCKLAEENDWGEAYLRAERLRLQALKIARLPKPFWVLGLAIRSRTLKLSRQAPDSRTGNYLAGRMFLDFPRFLGGDLNQAMAHFQRAKESSAPGDTRALWALSEAQLSLGLLDQAKEHLTQIANTYSATVPRSQQRAERAQLLLSKLESADIRNSG